MSATDSSPYFPKAHLQKQPEVFCQKGFLKNFAIFIGKRLFCSLFFIKLQALRPATLLQKTPTQLFSCDYCEIFKITFLTEQHRATAPVFTTILDISDKCFFTKIMDVFQPWPIFAKKLHHRGLARSLTLFRMVGGQKGLPY